MSRSKNLNNNRSDFVMFSMLVDKEFMRKLSVVAASKEKKKKDIMLDLLVPFVEENYRDYDAKKVATANELNAEEATVAQNYDGNLSEENDDVIANF